MLFELLTKLEHHLRPHLISSLEPKQLVHLYSQGRIKALKQFAKENPCVYDPDKNLERKLWGITFRGPLLNAAGMAKNGEACDVFESQGAAGFLGGTGTFEKRAGLEEHGIKLPFASYPLSGAASNKLSLPNDGDKVNSQRVITLKKESIYPIGWSVMATPLLDKDKTPERVYRVQKNLIESMHMYVHAGVDFLEINESCPNTGHKDSQQEFHARLQFIKECFLDYRRKISFTTMDPRFRYVPVIVKLSNDTSVEQVPHILDTLFDLGYDGVNFGNSSNQYALHREKIHPNELLIYDHFTQKHGGGTTGRILKEKSLELSARAVEYRNKGAPSQEFRIIRTGGIETALDLIESDRAGVDLNEWITGYWAAFAKDGHDIYKNIFEKYSQLKNQNSTTSL